MRSKSTSSRAKKGAKTTAEKGTRPSSTKHKRTEEALRKSEEQYHMLFDSIDEGFCVIELIFDENERAIDYRFLEVNQSFERQTGIKDAAGKRMREIAPLHEEHWFKIYGEIALTGKPRRFQNPADQLGRWYDVYAFRVGEPEEHHVAILFNDITEHRRAEEALRESEELYRLLLDTSIDAILLTTPEDGSIIAANPAACRMFGWTEEELKRIGRDGLVDESDPRLKPALEERARTGKFMGELTLRRKDGTKFEGEVSTASFKVKEGKARMSMVIRDITERKEMEKALNKSTAELREAQRVGRLGSWDWDARTDQISWSEEYYRIYGFDPRRPPPGYEDHLSAYTAESAARLDAAVKNSMQTGEPYEVDLELAQTGKPRRWITARGEIKRDENGQTIGLRGTVQDITERKLAENLLRVNLEKYRVLFESFAFGISVTDESGQIIEANPASEKLLGLSTKEHTQRKINGAQWQIIKPNGEPMPTEEYASVRALKEGRIVENVEMGIVKEPGQVTWITATAAPIPLEGYGLVITYMDITQQKRAQEEIHRQVERLTALKKIDRVIISSLDLDFSLGMLLAQAIDQLKVDAADVLIFDSTRNTLEFRAGQGFRIPSVERRQIRLGEGVAGHAALERRVIHIADLNTASGISASDRFAASEGFVSYFAVPLVTKGHVKGVMEFLYRSTFEPDKEWLDFLETLCQQAAIAVENIELFNDLQRSNLELTLAYDATIEGWSQAMDLRDHETEGHTQRVTRMAVELAKAMGLNGEELMHIRRGALLHDIGKIGVPDQILLKQDTLTAEEWQIMKQHPQFSYIMLKPINYLRHAIDIPYCHHEKWDGTGYPRGLRGDQIPLAARIFAAVDVWDALISNRPYRKAWSHKAAQDYIRSQSGLHFDPQAVEVFLKELPHLVMIARE